MTDATRGSPMQVLLTLAGALSLVGFCSGCATPEQTTDADAYTPRVYRTGSNIPVKDYGAANIEVAPPDIVNPIHRPMGQAQPRSGG